MNSGENNKRKRKERSQDDDDDESSSPSSAPKAKKSREEFWNENFKRLAAYKCQYGDCLVPHKYENDQTLASWVANQRTAFKANKLSADRKAKLDSIGFVWVAGHTSKGLPWDEMFEKLKEYKRQHGNCLVPKRYKIDPALGNWVNYQRNANKMNKISDERKAKLDSVGFSWGTVGSVSKIWTEMFERLKEYKRQHGNCLVPKRYKIDPALGNWVGKQRKANKTNKISDERKAKLDSIGFAWVSVRPAVSMQTWTEMFEKLKEYKRQHGNCLVPKQYKIDPALGNWINHQRKANKMNKISDERKAKLDSIGFAWEASEQTWTEMFEKLKEYKQQHGDCLVPKVYKIDPALGNWVGHQRKANKMNKISDERKAKLDSIGFAWVAVRPAVSEQIWTEMFEKLNEYKQQHGDCLVPKVYKIDPALGYWVGNQRAAHKTNKISDERKAKLDSIGFAWVMSVRPAWD